MTEGCRIVYGWLLGSVLNADPIVSFRLTLMDDVIDGRNIVVCRDVIYDKKVVVLVVVMKVYMTVTRW